jgi:hypothetical protein
MTRTQPQYTQASLPADGVGATGAQFVAMIRNVFGAALPPWVSVSDADISGNVRPRTFVGSKHAEVFPSETYLDLLVRAEQIVWINLFFCRDRSTAESISASEDYTASLTKADILARVVDAGRYYFYAPSDMGKLLTDALRGAEIEQGPLDGLEFPE